MGLVFLTPEIINERLNDFVGTGGCFPDFSYADVLVEVLSELAPVPLATSLAKSSSALASASAPALLPLEAFIDTEPEARLSQRYFMREGGFAGFLGFSLLDDSGNLSLPISGGGGAEVAFVRDAVTCATTHALGCFCGHVLP